MKKTIKKILCVVMAVALLSSVTITANAIWSIEDCIDWSCQKTTSQISYNSDGTPAYKTETKYDDEGLAIEEVSYQYNNGKAEFVPGYKDVYEYGANKLDYNRKGYRWDTEKNDWVLKRIEENKYVEYGEYHNLIFSQYIDYDVEGKILNGCKYEYTYNSNGDQELYIYETYNPDLEKWEFSYGTRSAYEYDANGNKISCINKNMSSREDEGTLSSKTEYTYAGDNLMQEIYYYFDSSDFAPTTKSDYTYDDKGQLLTVISYSYGASDWVNQFKYVYEYDVAGNEISSKNYSYNNSEWELNYNEIMAYDAENHMILDEAYEDGEKSDKYEMVYDSTGRIISMTSYDGENNEWVNTYKQEVKYDGAKNEYTINSYDWDGSQWINDGSTVYTTVVMHEKLEKISGQAPTTEATGWKDYYKCVECGKYFEDEKGNVEITDLEKWKAEGGNGYLAKLEVATSQEKSPKTGDNSVLLECLMGVALAGFVLCSLSRKKA